MEKREYPQAIKMYRMALDQIPDIHKGVRLKILGNIGSVFVQMGRYADAITSFETIMDEEANFKTGLLNNYSYGYTKNFQCIFLHTQHSISYSATMLSATGKN